MRTKKCTLLLLLALAILCVGVLVYLLLWDKLFPFSPLVVGFSRQELPHMIVYTQKGAEHEDFEAIDALIPSVEDAHKLDFLAKPQVFVFRDKESYLHRSLTGARFCAFSSSRVLISPWALKEAMEGDISLEIYLRHEFSHVLLFQHKGFLAELRFPGWLLEGIAVYTAGQLGTSWYPGKEETYAMIRGGNFMPPRYFNTAKDDEISLDVPYRSAFLYAEFACIVDYLVVTQGREKFQTYMEGLFQNGDHDEVFKAVYGMDFDEFLSGFGDAVAKSGK